MLHAIGNMLDKIPDTFWLLVAVIIIAKVTWVMWIHYVQQDFISGITWTMLEVVPPREVLRSPKAMELFITNALYHWSMKGGREEWWQGAVWFWFSLEIASIEGQVRFYIRTPSRLKEYIETQMYAQYPQAQVREVEDYTLAVDEISPESAWNGWGCEFKFLKPDPYPLKTYVDYGLDKDPEEHFKVDPISPVIELFGSIGKGEQMWMQIVVTPSKKVYHSHHSKHDWVQEGHYVLEDIAEPYTRYSPRPEAKGGGFSKEVRFPDWLRFTTETIVKKSQKLGFDSGIRVYYVAKKENFNMGNRRNLRMIFRQYNNPYLNSLARHNSTQADAYGGLIFVLNSKEVMVLANRMLNEYRERSFFHLPMRHHILSKVPWPFTPLFFLAYFHPHPILLNAEEIATLWHFPGQILKVPTLERIESKEAAPPTNLPT